MARQVAGVRPPRSCGSEGDVVVGTSVCAVKGSFRPSFGEKSDIAQVKDDGGLDRGCSRGTGGKPGLGSG